MKRINWAPEARDDLVDLDRYYRPLSPRFADQVVDRAVKAAIFLAEHPRAGPTINGGRLRKWTLRGSDYIILYRVSANGVDILRVRNAREDWWGE